MTTNGILIGKGETPQVILLPRANRHGLVAGATGTGKTVTLQVMAEGFSRAGVLRRRQGRPRRPVAGGGFEPEARRPRR